MVFFVRVFFVCMCVCVFFFFGVGVPLILFLMVGHPRSHSMMRRVLACSGKRAFCEDYDKHNKVILGGANNIPPLSSPTV